MMSEENKEALKLLRTISNAVPFVCMALFLQVIGTVLLVVLVLRFTL